MKFTISKYWGDIPFGHRQPKHEGHCKYLHGHNWGFTFTFTSTHRDEKGFVLDFGGLKGFKKFLDEKFDHKMVFNSDDKEMRDLDPCSQFLDITWVPDCSAEGLAEYLFNEMTNYLEEAYSEDVRSRGLKVVSVTVHEDTKNTASYGE